MSKSLGPTGGARPDSPQSAFSEPDAYEYAPLTPSADSNLSGQADDDAEHIAATGRGNRARVQLTSAKEAGEGHSPALEGSNDPHHDDDPSTRVVDGNRAAKLSSGLVVVSGPERDALATPVRPFELGSAPPLMQPVRGVTVNAAGQIAEVKPAGAGVKGAAVNAAPGRGGLDPFQFDKFQPGQANGFGVQNAEQEQGFFGFGGKNFLRFEDAGGGDAFGDIFGFGDGNFLRFQDAGGGDPFGDTFGFGRKGLGASGFSFVPADPNDLSLQSTFNIQPGRKLRAGQSALPPGVNPADVDRLFVLGGTSVVVFKDGRTQQFTATGNTATDRLGNTYSTDQFNPKLLTNRLSAEQVKADEARRAQTGRDRTFDPQGDTKKADPKDKPGGMVHGGGYPRQRSETEVRGKPEARYPDNSSLWSSIIIPEAARAEFFPAADVTPVSPLPLRYDAQWAMGPITEAGARYVGSLRCVDAEASALPHVGKAYKGEIWHDASLAGAGDHQPGENVKWVPVVRVTADLPPSTSVPEGADDTIVIGEEKDKGPVPFPQWGTPLGPKPGGGGGGGGERKWGGIDERHLDGRIRRPVEGETTTGTGAEERARQAVEDALTGAVGGLIGGPAGGIFSAPGGYRVPTGARTGTTGATRGLSPLSTRDRGQADAVDRAQSDDAAYQDANGWCGRDYGPGAAIGGPAAAMYNVNGDIMLSLAPTGADPNDPASYRAWGHPAVERTATEITVYGFDGVPGSPSWSMPTHGVGVPVAPNDGLTLASFPIPMFGAAGGPATLEDSVRLTQAQAETLRHQWQGFAGGSGHLEASVAAVGRNRDGRMPQAHSFSTHIGAETGAQIKAGGAVAEVYSVLDGNAGSQIVMNGDGVFNVRREIRGVGYTRDYRPLIHLQNDVGTTGKVDGDLIASSDGAFVVTGPGAVTGSSFTVPTTTAGSTVAASLTSDGLLHLGPVSSPTAPASGVGGYIYFKSDGKPYAVSSELAETDLSAAGGGGGNTHDLADAATSAISEHVVLDHTTSGTAAAGFGSAISTYLENAAGSSVEALRLAAFWDTATNGSEDSGFEFRCQDGGSNVFPLFYDHSGAGGNSLMQLEAQRINIAAATDGLHITGDVTLSSGARLTMDGRLDPGSVEFTDRGGSASLIPGSSARGFDYDSTVNAARPLWTREGTRTAVALFSDIPTPGNGIDSGWNLDISPLTTEATPAAGDWLLLEDAAGNILKVNWSSLPGANHDLLDGSVAQDTVAGTVVRGDLIVGNSTPAWERKARGSTGAVLYTDASGDIQWTGVTTTDGEVLTWSTSLSRPVWAAAGGGSSLPVADTTSIVEGSADATKGLRFEVDGFTTATTRVATWPDKDITVADNADVVLRDGTAGLSADWDAGSHQIRAETFQSDVTTGTAPFTVASQTVVTNLNASLLEGNAASAFATAGHDHDADYQPLDTQLTDISGLSDADGVFIVGSATGFVAESGATARTSLGLGDLAVRAVGDLLTGGAAELDGDKVDIDWTPSNYTPTTSPSEADSLDNLTAHLAGIDTAIGAVAGAPFDDGTAIIKGSADATKLVRFEVDGLTTGTTRVLTVSDSDGTIWTSGNDGTGSGLDADTVDGIEGAALALADVSNLTADVAVADGGTGASTATAGFDNLSPVTTLGDIIFRDASNNVRLAGNTTTTKQFLSQTGNGSVSAAPAWGALAAGDIPDLSATYQPLDALLTDIAAASPAKGSLFVYNGSDIIALGVGTNTHVLTADSAEASGIKWAAGGAASDHGTLTGLTDDDHTQYAILAGRSGGQTLTGGTGTSDNLTLAGTGNSTDNGQVRVTKNTSSDAVAEILGLRLSRTAGFGGAGLGAQVGIYLENGSGGVHQAATIHAEWTDATDTTEDSDLVLNVYRSGSATEVARLDGSQGRLVVGGDGVAAVGGCLHVDTSATGNVGTGEDTLSTYTLPAGALANDGDFIRVRGRLTLNGGGTLTEKLHFGSTSVNIWSVTSGWTGEEIVFESHIFRTGATAQSIFKVANYGAGSTDAENHTEATPAETLSGTVVIKVTGESSSGTNDAVVLDWLTIELVPTP